MPCQPAYPSAHMGGAGGGGGYSAYDYHPHQAPAPRAHGGQHGGYVPSYSTHTSPYGANPPYAGGPVRRADTRK